MQKNLSIVTILVLFVFATRGQCPETKLFRERVGAIYSSSKLSWEDQISALQKYVDTIKNCPYKNDSTHAYLLRMIGSRYAKLGDFYKAVQYFRESVNMIVSNSGKPFINQQHLIRSYYWLFQFYDSLNNVSEKMKAIDKCIDIAFQYNSPAEIECCRALYERVQYFFDIGDYHKSIEDGIMCEKLALEFAKKGNKADYELGMSLASSSLGWHIKSLIELKRFEQAEKLLAKKPEEYSKMGFKNNLGLIHEQLAQVLISKGEYKNALFHLDQAFKYEKKVGDDFDAKQVMKTIAYDVYFKHYHDNERALMYLRNALSLINKDKTRNKVDSFESMIILGHIANVFAQQERYDSAFAYFQLAFNQIKTGINETYFLKSSAEEIRRYKKIHYLTSLILDKADAFQKKYASSGEPADIKDALKIYKVADHLLNRIKSEQFDLESKLFWRGDNRRLYEHAIEACYLQDNTKDAFYFFEKSRAVLLNDQLTGQKYLGTDDILRQVQVKKEIMALERELTNMDSSSERYGTVQQKRFFFRQELDNLEQSIKVNNPLYYQNSLDTNFITTQDVQNKLLKDHQALVEIFAGDSAVYILALTNHKTFFNKINKPGYDTAVDSYLSYISNPGLLNSDFPGYSSVANHLYQLIFADVEVPKGRIIISSNGRFFPFEALVTNVEGRTPTYFLKDHAVSYTYSARYLLNNFVSNISTAEGSLLGVAPVQYATNSNLSSLRGSDESLSSISDLLPATHNLIGMDASTKNFLQQFPNYKILQLYTHASNTSNQDEPVIYFADGQLYLSDLVPEKPPVTRLVVLSACETGIGKLYQGEGIFSFNRGFAAFGVPSAISTLWAIDETATYRLTENFYKHLSKKLPIDVALQKAKLEFLQNASGQEKLPYYWAAIVLVGKTDSIYHNNSTSWELVATAAGAAGLLLFAGWKLRTRIKKISSGPKRMIAV